MRSIMSAGEQVGAEVVHWAREALGVTVNEMWGQTEFNYLVGNCSAIMEVRPRCDGEGPTPGIPWPCSTTPAGPPATACPANSRPGAATR